MKPPALSSIIIYFAIFLLGSLLFLPGLGGAHLFDWDEANFAEAAREMVLSHNWMRVQIDFHPFWEKPPLFIWMQAASMSILGISEYAARLPNAIIGIVTLLSLYNVGRRVHNSSMGLCWVLVYAGSWLPHFYFKSGIIDPSFNLLIFLAFYQLWRSTCADIKNLAQAVPHALCSGLFLGLAVLTKGPVAILLAVLCLVGYVIWRRGLGRLYLGSIALVALAAAITAFIWFGIDIIQNGWWFTNEFVRYQVRLLSTQDAGHGGPFYYHWIVLLIGCFPASLFIFQMRLSGGHGLGTDKRNFSKWMWLLLMVTLILFSLVRTKIVHYSSLCYFPLTYLAAREVYRLYYGKRSLRRGVRLGLLSVATLLGLAFMLLPIAGMYKDKWVGSIADVFARENLKAEVYWHFWEILFGLSFLVASLIAILLMRRNRKRALIMLFTVQMLMIAATVLHFVPKIEDITQGAAISFYRQVGREGGVVYPVGFKSYAFLYYSGKEHNPIPAGANPEQYLATHDIGKPIFFISKIMDKEDVLGRLPVVAVGEKNGWVFYRKK